MFLIVFIVPAYKAYFTKQTKDYTKEKRQLDSLIATWKQPLKKDSLKNVPFRLFAFNPNTSSKEELMSLGFSLFLASRVENYRTKGGKFIIKADLLKLYGMDTALYSTLYNWIELPVEKPLKKFEEKKEFATNKKLAKEKFDLNLADSTQFISVYGIGSKLSTRIIKYRDRLGGFISTDQLTEVYGLDTVVINELIRKTFIAENFKPVALEINEATEKELSTHPYIRYAIAKAITAYRFQHGNFKSLEDLTRIVIIDKPTFEKIKPYLSLNP